ncbi:transcription factor BTF3-like [Felis catus]|uniref:transcription factor BTF3-like n=1 Tax=Felis catus TaxID=9685 RepID=UPI001D19FB07|nr:transcription factor BTF3-like [Felis catus]
MKETIMNQEKLPKLQAQVCIGGKGTAPPKKKVVCRTATADDKKLQFFLPLLRLSHYVHNLRIHFNNPKVQAFLTANTFTNTCHPETKQLTEKLPSILSQLDAHILSSLRRLDETLLKKKKKSMHGKATLAARKDADDEVLDLVENLDKPSKNETN